MDHSYEEIRAAALDVISGRETVAREVNQYESLKMGVAEVLARREGEVVQDSTAYLSKGDAEAFLEVFWGLFREGVITLGMNDSNPAFPFFRPTEAGMRIAAGSNPYFFHDVSSYQRVLMEEVPTLDRVTLIYLQEAMQAFRAGCLLSATVMLGVSAEHTFMQVLEAAEAFDPWTTRFQHVRSQRGILRRANKFKNILDQHQGELGPDLKEDLDTHFAGILSLIRTSRNDAGHPTGQILGREQVYVLLQLFVTYCKKMYQLKAHFGA